MALISEQPEYSNQKSCTVTKQLVCKSCKRISRKKRPMKPDKVVDFESDKFNDTLYKYFKYLNEKSGVQLLWKPAESLELRFRVVNCV